MKSQGQWRSYRFLLKYCMIFSRSAKLSGGVHQFWLIYLGLLLYQKFIPLLSVSSIETVCDLETNHCVKSVQIRSFFSRTFSRIRVSVRISVQMRENTNQKKIPYLDTFHAVNSFAFQSIIFSRIKLFALIKVPKNHLRINKYWIKHHGIRYFLSSRHFLTIYLTSIISTWWTKKQEVINFPDRYLSRILLIF